MVRRTLLAFAIFAALAGIAPDLAAQTKNCTINLLPARLDFGVYSPSNGTPDSANATMQVRCNPNIVATVSISRGTNSTSFLPRTMRLGVETLPYNLHTTSSGNPPPVWGDGSAGTNVITLNATPQNKDFDLTIYGLMPIDSDVSPGIYTDMIAVTVNDNKAGDPDTILMEIRAQILAECTVDTFSLNFGTYAPVGTNATNALPGTATVNVRCTKGTTGTVQLTAGQWFAGGTRNLRNTAGELLPYNLFRESTYATVWNLTDTVSATSTSRTVPLGGGFTIYGRIPANEDVRAGSYTDTVQAIVNY